MFDNIDGIIKKPQPRQNKIIFVIIYLNWTVSLVEKCSTRLNITHITQTVHGNT